MVAPIRLGVLGCADVAVRRVLPAVAATPGVDLVAVASRDAAKAERVAAAFGGRPLHGYERLLDRADVDAVYVPLPSGLHAPWVRRALLAGKHVLAEKPLTTNLADTVELVGLAEAAGLVLRENFMFVHHGQHARVRELVADGVLGELRAFTAVFAIPERPAGDIRLRPELGGGALLDVGGYPVRAAQLLLGPDLEVAGAALTDDPALGVDLDGGALLRRADGVQAQLSFGLRHHYSSGYHLLGTRARLTVEHAFTPPAAHRPVLRIDRQDHREDIVLAADDQVARAVAAFADAVRDGPVGDPSIVAQARLVAHIGLAARPSPDNALDGVSHG